VTLTLQAALQPITVGTMSLPHRLFVPTHGGGAGSITADDSRFDDLVNYRMARVDDGFAWIGGPTGHVKHVHIPGFEATGVGALGKEPGIFRHPKFTERMGTFADRVHAKNAYLGIQLVQQGGMPSAPSSTFSGFLDHRGVHVLNHDEIEWIISEYIDTLGADTPLFHVAAKIHDEAIAQGFEMQDTASVCAVMEQRNGIKR
jgi:2,4-dienoyl-CoA reductase-like NADH-dependent reductase (Old Yellow Enzyme family)